MYKARWYYNKTDILSTSIDRVLAFFVILSSCWISNNLNDGHGSTTWEKCGKKKTGNAKGKTRGDIIKMPIKTNNFQSVSS